MGFQTRQRHRHRYRAVQCVAAVIFVMNRVSTALCTVDGISSRGTGHTERWPSRRYHRMQLAALTAQFFSILAQLTAHRKTHHKTTAPHSTHDRVVQCRTCTDLFVWAEIDQLILAVQVNKILHADGGQVRTGHRKGKNSGQTNRKVNISESEMYSHRL